MLLLGSWLEIWDLVLVLAPLHSSYLGFQICLASIACLFAHDQLPESICPSCHTVERPLCYSVIIN